MTDIRGRERIAHELGVSERTVSRMVANGLLNVTYEPAENNRVMVLPNVDTWQPLGLAASRVFELIAASRGEDEAALA